MGGLEFDTQYMYSVNVSEYKMDQMVRKDGESREEMTKFSRPTNSLPFHQDIVAFDEDCEEHCCVSNEDCMFDKFTSGRRLRSVSVWQKRTTTELFLNHPSSPSFPQTPLKTPFPSPNYFQEPKPSTS
jgi:hypothetical protein